MTDKLLENISIKTLCRASTPIEFAYIPSDNGENYAFLPKQKITGLSAPAGTGKSLISTELAFFFLHSKQYKKIIWLDFDDNASTLASRGFGDLCQAEIIETRFIKQFFLIGKKEMNEAITDELDKAKRNEPNELKNDEMVKLSLSTLKGKISEFMRLLLYPYKYSTSLSNGADYIGENVLIVMDALSDFLDLYKADEIKGFFNDILRDYTHQGVTILYLNHTTKSKDTEGKRTAAGSQKRQDKTDLDLLLTDTDTEGLINCETLKNRYAKKQNFAFKIDLSQEIGKRLIKCDFVECIDTNADKLSTAKHAIKAFLRDKPNAISFTALKDIIQGGGVSESTFIRAFREMKAQKELLSLDKLGYYLADNDKITKPSKVIDLAV